MLRCRNQLRTEVYPKVRSRAKVVTKNQVFQQTQATLLATGLAVPLASTRKAMEPMLGQDAYPRRILWRRHGEYYGLFLRVRR